MTTMKPAHNAQVEGAAAQPFSHAAAPDPRDPDWSRKDSFFALHNCSACRDGQIDCLIGNPRACDYPYARND